MWMELAHDFAIRSIKHSNSITRDLVLLYSTFTAYKTFKLVLSSSLFHSVPGW
jgi:hypothetical protein